MPLVVACPNCKRPQQVVAPVPPEGLPYACQFCQARFNVRVDPAAAAPPPPPPPLPAVGPPGMDLPPLDDLDGGTAGTGGGGLFGDSPPTQPTSPPVASPPPVRRVPAAPPAAPGRLPVRAAVTAPPAPTVQDDVMDLLAPRGEDVVDLLAPRGEDVPDLLAPRGEDISDLLAPRGEDISDLLAPRAEETSDLLAPVEDASDLLASREEVAPDLPASRDAPRQAAAPADEPSGLQLDVGVGAGDVSPAVPPLPSLNLHLGEVLSQAPAVRRPDAQPEEAAPSVDMGFSLEMDRGGEAPEFENAPKTLARPMTAGATEDAVPKLAPHAPLRVRQTASPARPGLRRLNLPLVAGTVGVIVLGAGAALFLTSRRSGPKVEEVLGPLAADVARDHYPAYQKACDELLSAVEKHPVPNRLRAAAAQILLTGVLARGGDRGKIARAEQALSLVAPEEKPDPEVLLARALLAVAKGKPGEVDSTLAPIGDNPDADLVKGLRHVGDGNDGAALGPLKQFVSRRPSAVVGQYLVARALEAGKPAEAGKAYADVRTRNATHFGALLGLARLVEAPKDRLQAVEELVANKSASGSPGELSSAQVAIGRAQQALGRSDEALASFGKALSLDPQNVDANLALGDAKLFEGRHEEALGRFRATGNAGLKTGIGRFGLGGALIATGKAKEGLPLVEGAIKENPKDPRGPYWLGYVAENASPADADGAATRFREALAADPTFLPAALELATLLLRQGKSAQASVVLNEAEAAGTPSTALQVAWGEALLKAGDPARAEEVFKKAIAVAPKHGGARMGQAAALEKQNKLAEAKAAIEKMIAELPDLPDLRPRLAAVCLKLGLKPDALDAYQAEIAAGKATPAVRVAMAKLAYDMGQFDVGVMEMEKLTAGNPTAPEALFTLARLYEARGEVKRATSEYRRALVVDAKPAVNLAFARALLKLGKEQDALGVLAYALSLPDGLYERGLIRLKRGEFEKALEDFDAATGLEAKVPAYWVSKGICLDRMGERARAGDAWRRAVDLAPDLGEAHYHLGRLELDRGKTKVGLDHLRKGAEGLPKQAPWLPDFYFQLASIETTSGSKSAARQAFGKFLEIAPPDSPARPEAERQLRRLGAR